MMTHIYLTAEEQKVFASLSEEVRNGWQLEQETLSVVDDSKKRKMRMQLMRLHDPKLQDVLTKADAASSVEAIVSIVQETSLEDVSDSDLEELFFALGPVPLSELILAELATVKTDEDLEGVVALTVIRHSLLEAMQPA